MTWHLFLDDERFPGSGAVSYEIARTSDEAIALTKANGMPASISFDHDLGGDDTAIAYVAWLTDEVLDGNLSFPEGFSFFVHSQNPIGAGNIRARMEGILRHASASPGP